MSRQQDRRALAPFLALFIVCFAAQGVSSASIGSRNNFEVVYSEETALTEVLTLSTDVFKVRGPAIFTCVSHYFSDIASLSTQGIQIAVQANRLVAEIIRNVTSCEDFMCKFNVAVEAFSRGSQMYRTIVTFGGDCREVLNLISRCTRDGLPTPPPTGPSPVPTTRPTLPTVPTPSPSPTESTRPPTGSTRPPTGSTRPPTESTRPPTGSTRPPTGSTRPPTEYTRPPTEYTRPPTVPSTTRRPSTTYPSQSTSRRPYPTYPDDRPGVDEDYF